MMSTQELVGIHNHSAHKELVKIYIKCRDPKHPTKFKDETITLKGTGEISFQQGCAITLPTGQKFKSIPCK